MISITCLIGGTVRTKRLTHHFNPISLPCLFGETVQRARRDHPSNLISLPGLLDGILLGTILNAMEGSTVARIHPHSDKEDIEREGGGERIDIPPAADDHWASTRGIPISPGNDSRPIRYISYGGNISAPPPTQPPPAPPKFEGGDSADIRRILWY